MDKLSKTTELLAEHRKLRSIGSFLTHANADPEKITFRKNVDESEGQFNFVDFPVNSENGELLGQREVLNKYFRDNDFIIAEPVSVINGNKETIFTTAGVQSLSCYIHDEDHLPSSPIFIAQPVMRTQFLDVIDEGSSINFINVATVGFNQTPEQHIASLDIWMDLFKKLGFRDELFAYKVKEFSRYWGDKQIIGEKVFIIYDGLEIGDASYVDNIDQKTRQPISLSDIGFGLERIRWILSGGSYFDIQVKGPGNLLSKEAQVYCSSLSLLASEGLEPSNKGAGYRFRLLSKRLVKDLGINHECVEAYIESCYDYWKHWAGTPCSKEDAINMIKKENTRNFNRLLLDELSSYLVKEGQGINVNVPTDIFVKRLKGTCLAEHIDNALISLGENNNG